mgnify:CR=1 FL=1
MEIKKISVVGGGTMGNGIAHVFAMKGYDVNLIETNEELWQRGFDTISKNLDRQVKKEIISSEDKDSILGRIHKIRAEARSEREAAPRPRRGSARGTC